VLEDLDPIFVLDSHPSPLSRNDTDHVGVGIAEAIKHACNSGSECCIQEPPLKATSFSKA